MNRDLVQVKRTTVIIPVESQVRELDGKLLLACVAAEHGYSAVIGSRGPLNQYMAKLPRGVFLAKGLRRISRRMFRILRGLGHEIVAWDEEALVRFPREDYYRRRLAAESIAMVSQLFAWGEDDAKLLREFPGLGDTPVCVTGNPRIDLLREDVRGYFDQEVAELQQEFGRFILINTNFGFVNAFARSLNLLQPPPTPGGEPVLGENTRGMEPDFARGLAQHKAELFAHFRVMIPKLAAAFPERTIIVRPHPSEDHGVWRDAASGHANVIVAGGRSVTPWLMASLVLIHNGCTTAVEAAVLGRPAISYRPVTRKGFDFELPDSVSIETSDHADLFAAVRRVVDGESRPREGEDLRREILRQHVSALDGPLAADRMIAALTAAGFARRRFRSESIYEYLRARRRLRIRVTDKREAAEIPGDRNNQAYHDHRFPGTTVAEIRARIGRFAAQLDRFRNLSVKQLSPHIFRIRS